MHVGKQWLYFIVFAVGSALLITGIDFMMMSTATQFVLPEFTYIKNAMLWLNPNESPDTHNIAAAFGLLGLGLVLIGISADAMKMHSVQVIGMFCFLIVAMFMRYIYYIRGASISESGRTLLVLFGILLFFTATIFLPKNGEFTDRNR